MADKDKKDVLIKSVPTILYFMRTYAQGLEGNDKKACRVFKDYESKEKLKRLTQELEWIKEDRVAEHVLDETVKKNAPLKINRISIGQS